MCFTGAVQFLCIVAIGLGPTFLCFRLRLTGVSSSLLVVFCGRRANLVGMPPAMEVGRTTLRLHFDRTDVAGPGFHFCCMEGSNFV